MTTSTHVRHGSKRTTNRLYHDRGVSIATGDGGFHDREQCARIVHTTRILQCTVLCTVWVTVHGHCSRTLFMGTILKKIKINKWKKKEYKNDPREFRASRLGIRAKAYKLPGTQCGYKHHSLV